MSEVNYDSVMFNDESPMPKTKGILMAAWGERGYIYAAYNAAFSIKRFNKQMPVYLYCDPTILKWLSEENQLVFDEIIPIDPDILSRYADDPASIKVTIYDHLPFDYTLFLDVDAAVLQDIEPAIDEMIAQGGYFYSHILNTHTLDQGDNIPNMVWANANIIWSKYQLAKDAVLPCTNSSFQFIKKGEESRKLFDKVHENIANPIPLSDLKTQWGGRQPDELYLNIAMAQMGITGKPSGDYMFMGNALSPLPYHKIQEKYYVLSIFGGRGFTKPRYTEWYDRLMIKYHREDGKHNLYKYADILRYKHANKKPQRFGNDGQAPIAIVKAFQQLMVDPGKSSDPVYLFSAWFNDGHEERQKELDGAIMKNLENPDIEKVFIVTEDECPLSHPKLTILKTEERPNYNTIFQKVNEVTSSDVISVICNGDIYMDAANVKKLRSINFTGRALALSRYEIDLNGKARLFKYEWSQDTWIFRGKIKNIDCDSVLGVMRCDNRIAFEMKRAGYQVLNPSFDIHTFHSHRSNKRNYDQAVMQGGDVMPVKPDYAGAIAKKKMLVIQPGKVGDILLCSPIAKFYSEEYIIYWQCPKQYHPLFNYLPYVTPVESAKEKDYAKVLDLSFGLGGKPEGWWQKNKHRFSSFVEAKYELAGVPPEIKNDLSWKRNTIKENALYEIIKKEQKFDYILCHQSSDYGTPMTPVTESRHRIQFQPILDYTIFDWYKVIMNATEIHCIDSSLCNFVDAIPGVKAKLFYYKTDRVPNQWDETILTKDWKRMTPEPLYEINMDKQV